MLRLLRRPALTLTLLCLALAMPGWGAAGGCGAYMVAAPAAPEHGHHGGPGGAPAGDHESPSREAPDRGASCEVVTHCAVPMPEQACVGALDGPPRTSPNDLDDAAPISPTGEPDSPPPRG